MIKQSIASEWLDDIDGMTVKQAINYLSRLDDNLILSYSLTGSDLQGVDVECCLIHEREETKDELKQQKEKAKQAKIARIGLDIQLLEGGIKREQRTIDCQSFVYSNNKPLTTAEVVHKKEQARATIDRYNIRIDKLREELKKHLMTS